MTYSTRLTNVRGVWLALNRMIRPDTTANDVFASPGPRKRGGLPASSPVAVRLTLPCLSSWIPP